MSLSLDGAGLVHPNGHRALHRVSLSLASGAGKTTLIRVLGTALRPTGGRVDVLGVDPWQVGTGALRALRARIGVVHQNPPIPPRLRVVTAVLAGRLGTWPTWKALASLLLPGDAAGAREALARLDLGDRVFDRCDRLSGGQLQRVGIARVLYQRPDLILADEAVGALVAASEANGATLIASLHAVDLALKWFPRLIGMKGGEVVFDRPTAAVTTAMLHELYATEGRTLPVQGVEAQASERGPNVLVLRRPGCQ